MRLNLKAFFLILSLLVFSETLLAQLSYREYRSIRSIGEEIQRRFPPEEFLYVGLGASPTAIMAYLESVLGPEAVTHLPFTNGKLMIRDYELNSESSPEPEQILNHHFKTFLPESIIKKKKILAIDYAHTGQSVLFLNERLGEYLANKSDQAPGLVTLALGRTRIFLKGLRESGLETLRLSNFAYHLFISQRFDEYRRFKKFDLTNIKTLRDYTTPELNRSPVSYEDFRESLSQGHYAPGDYDHLLKGIQEQMKKDPLNRDFYRPREFHASILYCHSVF